MGGRRSAIRAPSRIARLPSNAFTQTLGISVATVKLHVQSILMATGARNRTEVAIRAIKTG